MYKFFLSLSISFFLFGCASQSPAPIEFKSHSVSSPNSKETIKKRDLKLTDDSISAEEVKHKKQEEEKKDEPFTTTRELSDSEDKKQNHKKEEEKKSPINSKDLEKEMDDLEARDIEDEPSDKKEVGETIAPQKNPHHAPTDEKISFVTPVDGPLISKFGEIYMGKKNSGINIASAIGTDIKAVADGAVIYAGEDSKFGNLVVIKHNQGDLFSAYAHMNDLILKQNWTVKAGQVIGHVGKTGDVTKSQLHFAVRKGKTPVDPMLYIK